MVTQNNKEIKAKKTKANFGEPLQTNAPYWRLLSENWSFESESSDAEINQPITCLLTKSLRDGHIALK